MGDILIRQFNNEKKSRLEFTTGSFDRYAVRYTYYDDLNVPIRKFPLDREYFKALQNIGDWYDKENGRKVVYDDLYSIYEKVPQVEMIDCNNPVDANVVNYIPTIAKKYNAYKDKIELIYTIIYAGMLAEQLKEGAVVGKSVKMLGLHQVLLEDMNCQSAANCSKNKTAKTIQLMCKDRGIPYENVVSGV